MPLPPSFAEICDIAKTAVAIFARHGLTCCLTGGTACALYGTTRCPNDVDLVVTTTSYQQESLKQLLVAANSCFYLIAPRDPSATYRVLWYRLPGYKRCCKVDILIPGVLSIPPIPAHLVETQRGLPVMPLQLLLCLKLQSWADHRDSPLEFKRLKQYDDVYDIDELLVIVRDKGVRLNGPAETARFPLPFPRATGHRINQYLVAYPGSKAGWRAIVG